MWEERFDGIDRRLDTVDTRLETVDGRLATIDGRLNTVDGRLDRLEVGQQELTARVDALGSRFDQVDTRLEQVDRRFDELRGHMGVLHEDAIGRIAAISDGPLATKADINQVVARIDELIDRRIVPLEVAVRSLSRDRKVRGPRR